MGAMLTLALKLLWLVTDLVLLTVQTCVVLLHTRSKPPALVSLAVLVGDDAAVAYHLAAATAISARAMSALQQGPAAAPLMPAAAAAGLAGLAFFWAAALLALLSAGSAVRLAQVRLRSAAGIFEDLTDEDARAGIRAAVASAAAALTLALAASGDGFPSAARLLALPPGPAAGGPAASTAALALLAAAALATNALLRWTIRKERSAGPPVAGIAPGADPAAAWYLAAVLLAGLLAAFGKEDESEHQLASLGLAWVFGAAVPFAAIVGDRSRRAFALRMVGWRRMMPPMGRKRKKAFVC